ncbi:MAG: hypothetical protein AAEC86_10005, partial [Pseudohongiellaceae bacterium]
MSSSKISSLLLLSLLVILLCGPFIVFLLAVQTEPAVTNAPPLTSNEISRVEQLLLKNAPQSPSARSEQNLQLNADELNLLLSYSINMTRLSPEWAAVLTLADNTVNTKLTFQLVDGWIPLYLNFGVDLILNDSLLVLDKLVVGKLQVPNRLLELASTSIRSYLDSENKAYQDFSELIASVDQVSVIQDRIYVTLQWDPILISRISEQAQQLFISDEDQQRIMEHYRLISEIAATIPANLRAVSLNTFLVPMFTAANERSENGSDPIA